MALISYSRNIKNAINRNPEAETMKANKFTGDKTRSLYNARKITFVSSTCNTIPIVIIKHIIKEIILLAIMLEFLGKIKFKH